MGSPPFDALAFIAQVRWPLLESFALARQEGLAEPVGLVVDTSFPYGRQMSERLLLFAGARPERSLRATCVERATLAAALGDDNPELLATLRDVVDEPGHFVALVLAETGVVVTGSWQELIAGPKRPGQRQRERVG